MGYCAENIIIIIIIMWIFVFCSSRIARVIRSRRLRWAGLVARMEKHRSAFKILTGTSAGKTPLGRRRLRWEGNIRMDLKEIGIIIRNFLFDSG